MAHHTLTAPRVASAAPSAGSQTILETESPAPSVTLRLRAEPEESQHVRWAEDVVDNEGMGKKSSKVCCIYHKPHEPGDSDSEDSSSSDEESDDEPDLSRAQKAGDGGKSRRGRRHDHGDHERRGSHGSEKSRKPSPNAYERQPKNYGKKAG